MRVSKETKKKTEKKILQAAENLFTSVGYKDTTTRQIAKQAGIAAGTLFNYFPSKETLAMSLLAGELAKGREDYHRRRAGDEDFSEDIFLLISSEIRRLKPYRNFVAPVLESTMSIFSKNTFCPAGDKTRSEHLETVQAIIRNHGYSRLPDYISTSLYWSLYLGILAFWSGDESQNQQETLALMDYSINVFTQTISNSSI